MRKILLGGLSMAVVVAGPSIKAPLVLAAPVNNLYGITQNGDTAELTTGESDKALEFNTFYNGACLIVKDGVNIGTATGAAGGTYEKQWNDGLSKWVAGHSTSFQSFAGESILTNMDDVDDVIFEGNSTIKGNVGDDDNALKSITIKGGADRSVTFAKSVYVGVVNIKGTGAATITGTLEDSGLSTTDVTYTKDGTLRIDDNAALGTVTGGAKEGILILNGESNGIEGVAVGLKSLVLGGGGETVLSGKIVNLTTAVLGDGTSLTLGGDSVIRNTTLKSNSILDINSWELTGRVLAAMDGDGTVFIDARNNKTSVTGDVGTANAAVGTVINASSGGWATQTVDGKVFTRNVTIACMDKLTIRKTLGNAAGGTADVTFMDNGKLEVGGDATLGAVISDDDTGLGTGTLIMRGSTSTIQLIDGLKDLVLKGSNPSNVTVLGRTGDVGIATATVVAGNTLVMKDDSVIEQTNLDGTGILEIVSGTLFGDVDGFPLGHGGTVKIANSGNGIAVEGNIGSAAAVDEIAFSGPGLQWIEGTVDANTITVDGNGHLGILGAVGGSTAPAITFNADGHLNLDGSSNTLGAVTTATNGTGGLILSGTTTVDSIGSNTNALNALSASGATTVNSGAYANAISLAATLDVRAAGGTFGAANIFLDYDAGSRTFKIGTIDATGQILRLGDLSVTGSPGTDMALAAQWSGRTIGDTAVLVSADVLKFATLTNGTGAGVTFTGAVKIAGGGTAHRQATNLTVSGNLPLWKFLLAQTAGANASLLAVQNSRGLREAAAAGGVNMKYFSGVMDGMVTVVNDPHADPVLRGFIANLQDFEVATAVQQMADMSVNNGVSGGISGASQAVTNAISSNIGGLAPDAVASNTVVSGVDVGDVNRRNTVWLEALGSWSSQNRRRGVDGPSADTHGFAAGADTRVSDVTRLGLALHHARTRVDGKRMFAHNRARINTYGLTLYGQQDLDVALFLDGHLGYAYNDVVANRYVRGLRGKAEGSYGAHQVNIEAKLGYNAKVATNTTVIPHFGLDYTHLGENGHTEGGNVARLRVESRDTNVLLIGAGVRGVTEFTTNDKTKIAPEIRLRVSYDALASELETMAQFVGGGSSFTTRNVKPDPWVSNIGAGVNVITPGNISLSAHYDAALRDGYAGHTGSLRGRLAF